MQTVALTFRADRRFIEALKAYADGLGVSVNNAMKDIIAPVIGLGKKLRTSGSPRNDLGRFCGCLKDIDCGNLEESLVDAGKIDVEMWK